MIYFVLFGILFCGFLLYFVIRLRNFVNNERASESRLESHFAMLNNNGLEQELKNSGAVAADEQGLKPPQAESVEPQKQWESPPQQEQVIKEIRQGDQVEDGWDFAIDIDEYTAEYLGPEHFKGLENRVASIPGVDECKLENQQVFLVRTKLHSSEILVALFWNEFLHAAEISGMQR